VTQKDADRLFVRQLRSAQVRLSGQAGDVMRTQHWKIVPGGQQVLPSPALGWHGGGEIPVTQDDPNGVRSVEPFFEIRAEVSADAQPKLLHGRGGKIRFDQPWEPLLPRWVRDLRQLLQKRYQL
jgi:putative peptide zinc metalloprotease protein